MRGRANDTDTAFTGLYHVHLICQILCCKDLGLDMSFKFTICYTMLHTARACVCPESSQLPLVPRSVFATPIRGPRFHTERLRIFNPVARQGFRRSIQIPG